MKRTLVLITVMLLVVFCCPVMSLAYTEISLIIGDNAAEVNGGWHNLDAAPYTKDGRTMVPLRFIGEAFGADVSAYGTEDGIQARVKYRNVTVFLLEGDKGAHFVNESGSDLAVHMDVAPEIRNGRMFVPLRFIASNFGCDVNWYPQDQIVTIIQQN